MNTNEFRRVHTVHGSLSLRTDRETPMWTMKTRYVYCLHSSPIAENTECAMKTCEQYSENHSEGLR